MNISDSNERYLLDRFQIMCYIERGNKNERARFQVVGFIYFFSGNYQWQHILEGYWKGFSSRYRKAVANQ